MNHTSSHNPVFVEDQERKFVHFPKEPQWLASHIVHIDSNERDAVAYPNANQFTLQFRDTYKAVFSVELLNIQIPILAVPNPPFLWLVCPQLALYDTMVTTNTAVNQAMNTTATGAFAKIPIAVGAGQTEFFRKSEVRLIKKFKNTAGRLKFLQFELRQPDGTLYTLPVDGNWSATVELVSKV